MRKSIRFGIIATVCLCLFPEAWAGRQDVIFCSVRSFPAGALPGIVVHNCAGRVRVIGDQVDSIRVSQCVVIPGSGDVFVEIRPEPRSRNGIQTATGEIRLQIPAGIGVDLAVRTSGGALFDDVGIQWQNASRRERTGQQAGGGALVEIETATGDIHPGGNP